MAIYEAVGTEAFTTICVKEDVRAVMLRAITFSIGQLLARGYFFSVPIADILRLVDLLFALRANIMRVLIEVFLAKQSLAAFRAHHDLALDQQVADAALGQRVLDFLLIHSSLRVSPILPATATHGLLFISFEVRLKVLVLF